MKKEILFAMLLLPQLLVAQMNEGDALPMLEAGRSWNYVRTHADGTTDKVSMELTDTVIGKIINYRLVYRTPEGTTSRYMILESGNRLYVYEPDNVMNKQIFLETSPRIGYQLNGAGTLRVKDYVCVRGVVRQRCLFYSDGNEEPADIFVSGVGSQKYGLLSADSYADIVGSDVLAFESFTDNNGTVLFSADDFDAPRLGDFSYRPLLEDKKTWYCASYRSDAMSYKEENVQWYFQYFIDGDTVVNGKTCWKLYANNHYRSGKTEYICAAYEEDRKVYYFNEGAAEPQLLYDFSMNAGESVSLILPANLQMRGGSLQKIGDQFSYNQGQSVHTHYFDTTMWNEGTGSAFGLFLISFFGRVGANYKLLLCTVGDKTIYDSHYVDSGKLTSVDTPKVAPVANNAIYDLSGRRVANSSEIQGSSFRLPKGVYIQGGKKFVVK